jgi:TonB family protein
MNEVWTQWEGEVIGTFPLRRFLSASDHSGVFLTDHPAQGFPKAAIKIIPADPATAQAQLTRWGTATALSHPHLIRLLDSGRCQRKDHQFLFVAMEYAEQTLSEILPNRALTYEEVREMLIPTLGVLSFLHRNGLVQGHLKPSNFLVVDDQLKLASDTICPAGRFTASRAKASPYDSPETKDGDMSAAADIWSLGMTIVEALTQRPAARPGEPAATLSLPTGLPPTFVDTVRRCLSRNPADRPTICDLQVQVNGAPPTPIVSAAAPITRDAGPVAAPEKSSIRRFSVQIIGVLLIVLIAVWALLHLVRSNPEARQPASSTAQSSLQQAVSPDAASSTNSTESKPTARAAFPRADPLAQPSADASSSVLHEEIPDVPRSASNTIHGHFNVSVLVTVDRSGNVVDETVQNSGPSKYFTRAASIAARKWKFAPADNQDSREWLLSFQFARGGTTAHAASPRS